MSDKTNDEIIKDSINRSSVAQFYTAEWGEIFRVYPDGTTSIGQSVGSEIAKEDSPISTIKCPGWPNLDRSFWCEGWTVYDDEKELYITEDGRELSFIECIEDSCQNGEISDEIESLIQALILNSLDD